jgi:hypothetical protein
MARRCSGWSRWLAVVVTAALVPLSGCTSEVGGAAVKAKETDTANVALMDTGTYPTTLGHIFGTAGNDTTLRACWKRIGWLISLLAHGKSTKR